MSKLGLLVLIATFALSGGVTARAPKDGAKDTAAELRAAEVRAEPAKQPAKQTAKQPARAHREVIPLNTRGYNLPGPNDPAPAAIDEAPPAPVPTQR